MNVNLPAVVAFGIASWFMLRSRNLRGLEFVIVLLFGFFLASTEFGHAIDAFFNALAHAKGSGVSVTPTPVAPTVPVAPVVTGGRLPV